MNTAKKCEKFFPVIDIGACSLCKGCVEVAPMIFVYNNSFGMMEAQDLPEYDIELVDEAIKNCPKKCIHWDN